MKCDYTTDDIQKFYDNVMKEDESDVFLDHLSTCPECRNEIECYQNIKSSLQEDTDRDLNAPFLKNLEKLIMDEIRNEDKKIIHFPARNFSIFMKSSLVAAVLLITITYGMFKYNFFPNYGLNGKTIPVALCEVDYFYSDSTDDVILYDVDDTTKIIWTVDNFSTIEA